MTQQVALSLVVLGASLALFVWGRLRHDLVAVAALTAAVGAGLVPADRAFDGFAHPAVVTVALVLVLSRGLRNAGVAALLARALERIGDSTSVHVLGLTGSVAAVSAVMNNVAALSLMLPVAQASAERHGRDPSLLLMPLAFGSLLGGMTTLIGTPPNLIVSSYREGLVGERYGLLDFAPVGGTVALVGVAFIGLAGWRLLGSRVTRRRAPATDGARRYCVELVVDTGSSLPGEPLDRIRRRAASGLRVTLTRATPSAQQSEDLEVVQAGDSLALHGTLEAVIDFVRRERVSFNVPGVAARHDPRVFEAVVTSISPLVGRRFRAARAGSGVTPQLCGMARPGQEAELDLDTVRLKVGDLLLLELEPEGAAASMANLGLLPLASGELSAGTRAARPGLAVTFFAAALAASAVGLVALPLALLLAVLAYVLVGFVRPTELYQAVDWPVVVLLGAFIPVGEALHHVGATSMLAGGLLSVAPGVPVIVIVTVLLVVTMTLTDVLNNATAALVMAPIAASVAEALQASVDPFLMAIAIGASCSFLTPIGHQSNLLVMGPGGYQFGDYWRMGLPLQLVVVAVAVPMLLWVWPPAG